MAGSLGDASPSAGSRGRAPVGLPRWGSGAKPPEVRRMLRHEVEKPLTERKSSPYRLILYEYIIIISSSHSLIVLFPAIFVLKYKTQSACSRVQSQRNGPQWQPVLGCSRDGLAEGCTRPADPRTSSFGE